MSQKVVIELFYDIISPYSWIQFEALTRYAKVWPVELKLSPFYLGAVMKATGNRPPMTVPAKAVYMLRDLASNNAYWGMDLRAPENFVEIVHGKTTVACLRLLAAVQQLEPERLEEVSREMWRRIWTRGESIFERRDFEQALSVVGVKRSAEILAAMSSERAKQGVAANVDRALENGAFGAPWTIVTLPDGRSQSFFGSDRMPLIAHFAQLPFKGALTEYSAKL